MWHIAHPLIGVRGPLPRESAPTAEKRGAFINGRGDPAEAAREAGEQRISRGHDEWDVGDEDWPVSREVLHAFIAARSDANADGVAAKMQARATPAG